MVWIGCKEPARESVLEFVDMMYGQVSRNCFVHRRLPCPDQARSSFHTDRLGLYATGAIIRASSNTRSLQASRFRISTTLGRSWPAVFLNLGIRMEPEKLYMEKR
jgi:hypothetical protein